MPIQWIFSNNKYSPFESNDWKVVQCGSIPTKKSSSKIISSYHSYSMILLNFNISSFKALFHMLKYFHLEKIKNLETSSSHMHTWTHMLRVSCVTECVRVRGQLWSRFSPSTFVQALRIELEVIGLVSKYLHLLSCLTDPAFFFFSNLPLYLNQCVLGLTL